MGLPLSLDLSRSVFRFAPSFRSFINDHFPLDVCILIAIEDYFGNRSIGVSELIYCPLQCFYETWISQRHCSRLDDSVDVPNISQCC